jgi:branched-chain amino acid transport system substrate-binding protein
MKNDHQAWWLPLDKLGVALAFIALTQFGTAAMPATPEPYEINVVTPATGSGAYLGKSYKETFDALTVAINRSGGIKGRPVAFVLNDSQTSPQTGLQIVNGLIAKHARVFIDGGPSTVCGASVPVVQNSGPVDYCLSPVIHPPSGSYVFSAGLSSVDQARLAVRYYRERGWTKLAMLSSTDTTGADLEHQTDLALADAENKGVQIVTRDHFNGTDLSVAAQIARIKSSAAQAVLVWTTGTPFGTVVRAMKDAGLGLPVLTTNSNMTYAQMSAYADTLPAQMYFPALLALTPEATGKGPLHDAQQNYLAAFKAVGVHPDEGHILAWDPTMIVVTALRSLGPDATATQIRDFILHLHGWVGVDGVYDFSSGNQRGVADNAAAIARWSPAKGTWVRVSRPQAYLK